MEYTFCFSLSSGREEFLGIGKIRQGKVLGSVAKYLPLHHRGPKGGYVNVFEKVWSWCSCPFFLDRVMSLAQISSMPVAVCNGIGATAEAANNEAAKSALLYLKMMTKKKAATPEAGTAAGGQKAEANENTKANGQRKKK